MDWKLQTATRHFFKISNISNLTNLHWCKIIEKSIHIISLYYCSVPHLPPPPRQKTSKTLASLDTAATLMCIFSSILNWNEANQNNLIIETRKCSSGDLLKSILFLWPKKNKQKSRQALPEIFLNPQYYCWIFC